MKQNLFKSLTFTMLMALAAFVYFSGCSNDTVDSLYNENAGLGATPVIGTVDPPVEALANVTEITISGQNFLPDTGAVKVYFGKLPAVILSASATKLTVISPNVSGDLQIRVATNQAVQFSNSYDYTLLPAAQDYYPNAKDTKNKPVTITSDQNGNIYSSNMDVGVVQITPDSVTSLYSPKSGESFLTSMRFGSAGEMYVARGLRAIFTIPSGGGVANSVWKALSNSSIKISLLEFDPLGYMWAAGDNTDLFRFTMDKNNVTFPFDYNVTAMRVFVDGGTTYLYVAAKKDSMTKIMRMPLDSNGEPGSAETYFDFSENYGANFSVNDIIFSADGDMYLATDLTSPIVFVKPDKSHGLLYEGILLESPALSFAWGTGNFLYYVRQEILDSNSAVAVPQTIVKLNMLKPGAPNYY